MATHTHTPLVFVYEMSVYDTEVTEIINTHSSTVQLRKRRKKKEAKELNSRNKERNQMNEQNKETEIKQENRVKAPNEKYTKE